MQRGSSMRITVDSSWFILSSKFGLLIPDLLMAWSERLAWVIFLVSQNHENKHQPCWIGKSSPWPDLFVVMFFWYVFAFVSNHAFPSPDCMLKPDRGCSLKKPVTVLIAESRNLWEFDHQTFAKHSYIILDGFWWMWTHSKVCSWHRTTSGDVSKYINMGMGQN